MSRSPNLVTVGPNRVPLRCLVCQGQLFTDREIMLNTSSMEFIGLGWANRTGTALICAGCGFVHTFADRGFDLWKPGDGYPGALTGYPGDGRRELVRIPLASTYAARGPILGCRCPLCVRRHLR